MTTIDQVYNELDSKSKENWKEISKKIFPKLRNLKELQIKRYEPKIPPETYLFLPFKLDKLEHIEISYSVNAANYQGLTQALDELTSRTNGLRSLKLELV